MKRNQDITCAKAMGIMLMVLCHAIFTDAWHVQPVVAMFHMPLFFFFSGYCLKTEYFDKPHVFVWKRVKGVYWPYLKWSVVFLLLHNVFVGLNIYNVKYGFSGMVSEVYDTREISERLWSVAVQMLGHEQLLGGYWFLRVLFLGSLVSFAVLWAVDAVCRKIEVRYACGLLIGGGTLLTLCLMLNYMTGHDMPYLADDYFSPQTLLAAVFLVIGHGFRTFSVKRFNVWQMAVTWMLVLIGSFFWKMGMAELSYSSFRILPYIVTAVLATWAIYSLPWHRLTGYAASLVHFIGNNTLTILTWHFLAFKLVSLTIIYMYSLPLARLAEFPVITDYAVQGWWTAYFLTGMVVTCAVAYCNHWIKSPWLKL